MDDQPHREGPRGPGLGELGGEIIGTGPVAQTVRTLRDTLWAPHTVVADAFADGTRYLSPVKLFVALSGLMLTIAAFFGSPFTPTLENFFGNGDRAAVYSHIANAGHDPAQINAAIERWMGVAIWPIILLSCAPFIIALKLCRPSITWWGHVLSYLVATNAGTLLGLAGAALVAFGMLWFAGFQAAALIVFFYALLRIGAGPYRLGAAGLVGLFTLAFVTLIVTIILAAALQLALMSAIVAAFDLSLFELMSISAEASQAG